MSTNTVIFHAGDCVILGHVDDDWLVKWPGGHAVTGSYEAAVTLADDVNRRRACPQPQASVEIVQFPVNEATRRFSPTYSVRCARTGEFWTSRRGRGPRGGGGRRRAWSSRGAAERAVMQHFNGHVVISADV